MGRIIHPYPMYYGKQKMCETSNQQFMWLYGWCLCRPAWRSTSSSADRALLGRLSCAAPVFPPSWNAARGSSPTQVRPREKRHHHIPNLYHDQIHYIENDRNRLSISMYIYIYVCIVCICICVCVYIYICMCIYIMYIYIMCIYIMYIYNVYI